MQEVDRQIENSLKEKVAALEDHFDADCVFYFGQIFPGIEKQFRRVVEELKRRERIVVLMNTPGGSVETVEKLVEITRYHYAELQVVVPEEAMSAGTIFCMACDKIHMDYSSSLGPIDPQVYTEKGFVPALGYLDQVERMIEKSRLGQLSDAELLLLQMQDLALLSRYEQAKNLTITLLKKWLVEYKFKDWATHQTNPKLIGQPVTPEQKSKRAEEIATILADNKRWHSHGRKIGLATLQKDLRLQIDDYSTHSERRKLVLDYNDLLMDYVTKYGLKFFLHSRDHFGHRG